MENKREVNKQVKEAEKLTADYVESCHNFNNALINYAKALNMQIKLNNKK